MTSRAAPASSARPEASAPVHDFDCIYSHDIQRKRQKRWHDGFLRFHTFNRRVMVYDIPRNFIGDTHLKDTETLQDGDELRLDRGVLVEVGESRGSVRQDVTPLFEKKRPPLPPPPAEAEPRRARPDVQQQLSSPPPLRPSMLLKPKPLNVVLGPRRGLQGRAVLAKQSPYEQIGVGDRLPPPRETPQPAKRPRIHEPIRPPAKSPAMSRPEPAATATVSRLSKLGDSPARPLILDQPRSAAAPESNRRLARNAARNDGFESAGQQMAATNASAAPNPAESRDRVPINPSRKTSKLKVTTTKRPKLMCLAASRPSLSKSKDRRDNHSDEPRDQPNDDHCDDHRDDHRDDHHDDHHDEHDDTSAAAEQPRRRAPLRVTAEEDEFDSSPPPNFTLMDFPTTQDLLDLEPSPPAGSTVAPPAAAVPEPPPQTYADLDRTLFSTPTPAPASLPTAAAAPTVPPAPAAHKPNVSPAPPHTASPPSLPLATVTHTEKPLGRSCTTATTAATTAIQVVPPPADTHASVPRTATAAAAKASDVASAATPAVAPTVPRAALPPATVNTSTTPALAPAAATTTTAPPTTEPDIGPWSRTAFDLFGFAPPPGATAAALTAAKRAAVAMRGSTRGMMRECWD